MEKGDKVKVLPNKKIGIVDRVEDGFIFLEGSNRPYMRGQLAYVNDESVKSIYDEAKNNIRDIEITLEELDNTVALESVENLKIFIERAKKVEELVEEYQYLLTIIDLNDLPQVKRIKTLEEKLK